MASRLTATSQNDRVLSFVVSLVVIGGGFYLWRGSRKADVSHSAGGGGHAPPTLHETCATHPLPRQLYDRDMETARPTRHMVDLNKRVDRESLERWLAAQDAAERGKPDVTTPDAVAAARDGGAGGTALR
jgi:hypothetical protein